MVITYTSTLCAYRLLHFNFQVILFNNLLSDSVINVVAVCVELQVCSL